jgi:predicted Zn finger-like uncharacterized protein
MPLSVTCPHCGTNYNLAAELRGKKVRCKACQETFVVKDRSASVDDPDEDESPALVPDRVQNSLPPTRKSNPARVFYEDEERPRRRDKNRPVKQGSSSLLLLLVVGGVAALLFFLICAVGAIWAFAFTRAASAPAQAIPVEAAPNGVPLNANPPAFDPPAPIIAPAPLVNAPPVNPAPLVKGVASELYGDQGGDLVAPADAGLPNTVMRARRDDTFFKLSNPREGQTEGPGPRRNALLVDYEALRRGKFDGGTLVVHTDDGGKAEVPLHFIAGRDHGTIELVGVTRFGNLRLPKNVTFPKNAEMYVTRGDARYRPPSNFMVSNSLVMGEMKITTRARNWTPEEIDIYGKPPPNYTTPNVHPTVGEDVPPLSGMGVTMRYVEPNGQLLGLDYRMGEWEKEKCVGGLVPIFSADQPPAPVSSRAIARPGYAVAGAEVHTGKYVDAIRLLFRRVKADGTLDATDAYASEWIGDPSAGEAKTLANDGRRVLGVNLQQGAVLDRFALVVSK